MSKFSNPLINIKIASPCRAEWNEMIGDDRTRFCGECKLNVYNLSAMSQREAENLLISYEGRLCVRFYKRADGTILTQDCPVGWQAVRQRVSKLATAFASLVFTALSGIGFANYFTEPIESQTMGTMLPKVENLKLDEFAVEEVDSNFVNQRQNEAVLGGATVEDYRRVIGASEVTETKPKLRKKHKR